MRRKMIRRSEVEEMKIGAAEAGDYEQVQVCDLALAGDLDALGECVRVMNDAIAAAWAPVSWRQPDYRRGSKDREEYADLYGEGAMLEKLGN